MGDKCGRQVCKLRGTSLNSCGDKAPRVGDKGGDKCKLMRPKEPRVGDKCGRQVWETSGGQVGDKLMRPKAPRVGDKCGRQGGDKCKLMRPKEPRVGDKGETSVNSCGPRHPEWETRGRQV